MKDQHLDDILNHLKQTPNQFYGYKLIFDNLSIPFDESEALLTTLERNGHIVIKPHDVWLKLIKITQEGIDFITRTSYQEQQSDNGVVSRHHTLKLADQFGINDKIDDMPKTTWEKIRDSKTLVFWGIVAAIIATLILLMQVTGILK